tara:strand:- start:423 stop:932 length:510 start_codon:yes stop_codon:yes gene_type:complete
MFAQLCELSNSSSWNTEKAQLIAVGIGTGGTSGLNAMVNQSGVNSPWVQDFTYDIWNQLLEGYSLDRKKVVLLDANKERRYVFQYSGAGLSDAEVNTLLTAIDELVAEIDDSIILGDVNNDGIINVLDIIAIVNLVLANEYDEIADVNEDGVLNVLDIISIVNIIINNS